MVVIVLEPVFDSLLRQLAADLDLPVTEVGRVLLESSLMLSLDR